MAFIKSPYSCIHVYFSLSPYLSSISPSPRLSPSLPPSLSPPVYLPSSLPIFPLSLISCLSPLFLTLHIPSLPPPASLPPPGEDLNACDLGWEKFQGVCYRHFSKRQGWEVAEQHCRMLGANLVSIMSPEEQDYVNGTRPLPSPYTRKGGSPPCGDPPRCTIQCICFKCCGR